jgi:hypothetical protein
MLACGTVLQTQAQDTGSGGAPTTQGGFSFSFLFLLILIWFVVLFIIKTRKVNQLKKKLAEKEDNKIFKIKEDGTIVRVDENYPDSKTDIIYCPYCGRKIEIK